MVGTYHLALLNIGLALFPVDDPLFADFMDALDEINALAEASPGFVWRLQTAAGNATSIHAFDDPNLLMNMSVWENADVLFDFVYKTSHQVSSAQLLPSLPVVSTTYGEVWNQGSRSCPILVTALVTGLCFDRPW